MELIAMAKDAVTLGSLVYTVTQMIKGLIRWRAASDVPAPLIQAIAMTLSLLIALLAISRGEQTWNAWALQVLCYGVVVLLPIALTGHEIAQLGRVDPAPAIVVAAAAPPAPAPVPVLAAPLPAPINAPAAPAVVGEAGPGGPRFDPTVPWPAKKP